MTFIFLKYAVAGLKKSYKKCLIERCLCLSLVSEISSFFSAFCKSGKLGVGRFEANNINF